MLNLFNRPQKKPTKRRPVIGTYNGYTFSDWQSSDEHIKWMREQMQQPKFRDMLAVLTNARPQTNLAAITEVDAAVGLGRRIGYDEVIATLLSLANFPDKPAPDVEADYGANEFDLKNVT